MEADRSARLISVRVEIALDVARSRFFGGVLALVVKLFALAKADLKLGPAAHKVYA